MSAAASKRTSSFKVHNFIGVNGIIMIIGPISMGPKSGPRRHI